MANNYDFGAVATKYNVRCADGRTILPGAFSDCDGVEVPIFWNHKHGDVSQCLGHGLLKCREDKGDVYMYGSFNDTQSGKNAKAMVKHGDIKAVSIYANHLKEHGGYVQHGMIREVSLVPAGANPGAFIDLVISHADDDIGIEAIITTDEEIDVIEHSDKEETEVADTKKTTNEAAGSGKTVQDVLDEMTDEQRNVTMYLVQQALNEKGGSEAADEGEEESDSEVAQSDLEGGDYDMSYNNIFDQSDEMEQGNVLTHDDFEAAVNAAKGGQYGGSLKKAFAGILGDSEAVIQHGVEDIDQLFPEYHNLNTTPEWIKRDTGWVGTVMKGVRNVPFSRIKSRFADITGEEMRSRGYLGGDDSIDPTTGKHYRDSKGNIVDKNGNKVYKEEDVFSLLKRTTDPQMVYHKQSMDRDDIIDITDFDVVAWIKSTMRESLDEELARAILIGDGRKTSSSDKIREEHIRPIWTDEDLFTIKMKVEVQAGASSDTVARAIIQACNRARKNYRGSGNPVMFTTEDYLTDMLLLEDSIMHRLYNSPADVAAACRCSSITTVPVMENKTRVDGDNNTRKLVCIIVNLSDYAVGADKGGSVNMFEDFDIDYNREKYLIETKCSGALVKPYSAIVIEIVEVSA